MQYGGRHNDLGLLLSYNGGAGAFWALSNLQRGAIANIVGWKKVDTSKMVKPEKWARGKVMILQQFCTIQTPVKGSYLANPRLACYLHLQCKTAFPSTMETYKLCLRSSIEKGIKGLILKNYL